MEIYYIPPESSTVQGKESAIYKKIWKGMEHSAVGKRQW